MAQTGGIRMHPARDDENRFRLMADSVPAMIWVTDADGRFRWLNRTWLEFTGRTHDDECGHGWLAGVHAEDAERCGGIFRTGFDARQPFSLDLRLRRHDGAYRWMLLTAAPRCAPDGAFEGYTGSCIDIHERKLLEEQLAERTCALRLAERHKNDRLLHFAHELCGMLSPIANVAAIMKRMEASTPSIAPLRQIIDHQVEPMRRMIVQARELAGAGPSRAARHETAAEPHAADTPAEASSTASAA